MATLLDRLGRHTRTKTKTGRPKRKKRQTRPPVLLSYPGRRPVSGPGSPPIAWTVTDDGSWPGGRWCWN